MHSSCRPSNPCSRPSPLRTAPRRQTSRSAADTRRQRIIALLVMLALALLLGEFARHAYQYTLPKTDQTKGDFLAFYEAAQAMRTGGDLYTERHRNYIYPPLVAFLYMPLTVF